MSRQGASRPIVERACHLTQITQNLQPASTPVQAAIESPQANTEHVLSADIAASELLVQLGYEYFAIGSEPSKQEPTQTRLPLATTAIDPHQLATDSAAGSTERDFWEEVALATERAPRLAPNQLGAANDTLAYAIATVSASYTLPSSDRRATAMSTSGAGAQPAGAPPASPKAPARSDQSNEADVNNQPADLFEALASLLGFEEVAGLGDAREIDPAVFQRARELAAAALVATETNRNSALKAAEGRRG